MASPIIPLGIAMLGGYLGSKSVKEPNMIDPRLYKDELTYSDTDIMKDVNMLGGKFSSRATKAVGDIKQFTAANRMPEGAAVSGIAGVQGEVAKNVGFAMPGMRREQSRSYGNYIGAVNRYEQGQTMYGQAQTDRNLGFLGNLGKIALLWQQGLLGGAG